MSVRTRLAAAALAACFAFPAAVSAALPRGTISTVVRVDGRRALVSVHAKIEAPVTHAYIDRNDDGRGHVVITGGRTEMVVSVDMLDDRPAPEGLEIVRARLIRATPDSSGRRTWNPPMAAVTGGAFADILFAQDLDGPAWEQGARVDARVRLTLRGEPIIVELGQFRLGGDFTLFMLP